MQARFSLNVMLAALCLLLAACVSPPPGDASRLIDSAELLRGDVFHVEPGDSPAHPNLTLVDDDMRAFIRERVPSNASQGKKAELILRAILDDGLSLDYDSFKTLTAQEAFYQRKGNCLSFTNLFVAMAREAGLKVTYQEVDVPPNWEQRNDTYFYNRHINALVHLPWREQKAVDFNIDEFDSSYPRQSISDNYALAQYFNNMGVHWLEQQRYDLSFIHLREAIRLQPRAAYFWTNMGSLYSRAGFGAYAEAAWLRALDIDKDPSAMGNLARYYTGLGETERAHWYMTRVEHYRRQNPYYLYELAEAAYREGEYEASLDWLHQSLRLRDYEHRFYRLQGLVHLRLGDAASAKHSFELAERHASNDEERDVYTWKQRLIAARE